MATSKLIIRNKRVNEHGKTLVYVRYTHDERSFIYSTGEKIDPNHWDPKEQKVKAAHGRGYKALNDKLKEKKDDIEEIRLRLENSKPRIEPTIEAVRDELNERLNKTKTNKKDFFELLDDYIFEKSKQLSYNTVKHFTTTKNHLLAFQNEKKYKVRLETMDDNFYIKFLDYLYNHVNDGKIDEKRKKQILANNSVGSIVKDIKTFLNYLTNKGLYAKADYKRFKKPKAPTDIVYCTKDEIEKIKNADLKQRHGLERARDLFLIGVYTGLRYADYSQIRPENIKDGFFYIHTRKTDKSIKIPMLDAAKEIVEKYDYRLPTISNQKLNDYIKIVCQLAKLTEPVEIVQYYGPKEIRTTREKWELIGTHTARRTFITQSLERGMRPEVIMKITGHADVKTMMRYVKITEKVVEMEMLRAWNEPVMKLAN